LFILQDYRCIFVPFGELRGAISQKVPNEDGTFVFGVNPGKKEIDRKSVEMEMIVSRTHKRKIRNEMLADY